MPGGAALAAARKFGAGEIIDPRPFAVGSIAGIFRKYPHLGPVLPAMGYQPDQIRELERTIESVPCDMVLSATPADLARLMSLTRRVENVYYGITEPPEAPLSEEILAFLSRLRH
jgi:predicted GTPase